MLFITSEVFFFLRFFWAFYDSRLSPSQDIGMIWPPKGVLPLAVYSVPLLNTTILLSSGVSVTWAHHSLSNNLYRNAFYSLLFTIILGVYFLFIQYEEYCERAFSVADGVYGRTFFVSTGFHGIHVIVGTRILIYTLIQLLLCNITFQHHFVFEASAWY
jgi:cytochrome c oxidase subunit 3